MRTSERIIRAECLLRKTRHARKRQSIVMHGFATFLPSGPGAAFSDSLYAWKIAKFGYSATAPLRARRWGRLEPVPAPLTLHYPH